MFIIQVLYITAGCRPGEFQCAVGGCIDISKRCDNVPDCADGSDEEGRICGKFFSSTFKK